MAIEASGNINVASVLNSGLLGFSPAGELIETLPVDDRFSTNVAFGGQERMKAYVTLSGRGPLAIMDWPRPELNLAR
jgi:gluconolactonase